MKFAKLTAYSSLLIICLSGLMSCDRDDDHKVQFEFTKSGIVMSGAQAVPVSTSAGLGKLDVFYTRETRILNYTLSWTGLTNNVTSAHIHGLAPQGYTAPGPEIQLLTLSAITKCAGNTLTSCGSYSGTLLVDGVKIKENDLLNGMYYIDLHTAAFPGGEIRAQIRFQ